MIARCWWPLQRWLAVRRAIAIPLVCVPVAAAAYWRPPPALWPAAIASVVAVLAPVVLRRGDGSRRRLAGRATGAAFVIVQPLMVAALLVDVRLLVPLAAAAILAVIVPAVVPVRTVDASQELAPEARSTYGRWALPLIALVVFGLLLRVQAGLHLSDPDLDVRMLAIIAACTAIWIGVSMRLLLALAIAAAVVLALTLSSSSGTIVASPLTVALALATPLGAWFQRESEGGFPVWTPALIALATTIAYVRDPAWPVMTMMALLTWLVAVIYPAQRSTSRPDAAGILDWTRRLFVGLEPYWRFYARAKLARDPIYARLSREGRDWGRVLDAGCGPGLTAAIAAGRVGTTTYLGIDLDADKLLVARRALALSGRSIGGRWRLHRAHFPLATPPAECFDTVLLLDVLHYWSDDLQASTLAQLTSLLHPDGRLYLREGVAAAGGDAGTIERGERFTTFFGLNPENALTFLGADRIAALIAGAGLAVESEERMGGENRLWICRRI